jgi:predicted nucleotidyltransferase
MTRADIVRTLELAVPELRAAFGVGSVAIFGSAARDEHRADSDIDILGTFTRSVSLFDLASLRLRLVELLGREVDLGTPGPLRPSIRDRVMQEALRVA